MISPDTTRLAAAFAGLVRLDLAKHLPEIVRRNREDYAGGASCATHDFCDANMVMLAAFEDTFGREPRFLDGTNGDDAYSPDQYVDLHLWNNAWDMAREADFADVGYID
jgi:hypothetical protein